MELLILLAMILTNGVFAMSEIAVVSAKRIRLQQLAEAGAGGARVALDLAENPARFLSTIQVGITSIGILSGAYGEAALVSKLEPHLDDLPIVGIHADELALAIVVIGITFFSLILGELVPKRLALHHPEAIAMLASRPMNWLARAASPFVHLLTFTTEGLLRLVGVRERGAPPVTEEEIQGLMKQGTEAGIFEQEERALVSRVFRLDERKIPAIMTPRVDVVMLDLEDPIEVNLQRVTESRYTRFPVCRGGFAQVVGILNTPDLLERALSGQGVASLAPLVKPPVYIPISVTVMDLLEHFKRDKAEMALVVDEFGDIEGLVTLNDVLKALVGELPATDEEESDEIVQREDGSWLIDGSVAVDRLREVLDTNVTFPDEASGSYHTVAGLVMAVLGRIPRASDHFLCEGFRFEVVDMDRNRIDRVLVSQAPEPVLPPTGTGEG
jgi:putative hemolysin